MAETRFDSLLGVVANGGGTSSQFCLYNNHLRDLQKWLLVPLLCSLNKHPR